MAAMVGQIARLRQQGCAVILVSSGAVAAGRHKLGENPRLPRSGVRQVWAAVGQSVLMDAYDQLFQWHGITVAQTLVTRGDLQNRLSYLNARNTLLALMELGVVPIVNENDVVAVEELEGDSFGDNDNLSALVANLVDADALVILTDTDGLYTADPSLDSDAKLIPLVTRIDAAIEELAGRPRDERSRGGMVTKIQAAKLATASGVTVVIASGREQDVLLRLAAGEQLGTLFTPTATKVESRKRWMLSGLSRRGVLVVDDGAAEALRSGNRSLLPAGVSAVDGDFQRGDIVSITDTMGRELACGMVNYGVQEVRKVKGLRSAEIESVLGYSYGDEVIHRNNLALL
jgi:glutamate 5-kinase